MTPGLREPGARGRRTVGYAFVFGLCLCAGAQAAPDAREDRHARAVADARAGRFGPALATLETLHARRPDDRRVLADYLAVLAWSGRAARAAQAARGIAPDALPRYTQLALGRAYRDLGDLAAAGRFYDAVLARDPRDFEARLGLAVVRAEQGSHEAADARFDELALERPDDPELIAARAFAYERSDRDLLAARTYERLLVVSPAHPEALARLPVLVARAGAPYLGAERLSEAVRPDDAKFVRAERAAYRIRWGELPVVDPEQRFVETDAALAELDAALGRPWSELDYTDPYHRRLVFDRMVALRDRVRMDEVVAHHEAARAAGVEVPVFALIAAGDAYLYRREAEKARALYREVMARAPDNPNAPLSLFYAHVDLDEFTDALALVERVKQARPALGLDASGRMRPTYARFEAELTETMGLAFADALRLAQRRLEAMRDAAPDNNRVRRELAQIYAWRGWPEAAAREYRHVLDREPESVGARVGAAANAMTLAEYEHAEREVRALSTTYPEHGHVARLERAFEIYDMAELFASFRAARSDGPQIGTSDLRLDNYLFAPPVDYRVRPFVHHHLLQASLPEGRPRNHRVGVGIEYAYHRGRVRGEVGHGFADNSEPALSLGVIHHLSDGWEVDAFAEWNTIETPLRAIRVGVTSDRLGFAVVRRFSELGRVSVALDQYAFSDGNDRTALAFDLERRLFTSPRLKLTGIANFYASHNTEQGVAYFNPENDYAVSGTLFARLRTWRDYERHFYQHLKVSVGDYWQEGFGHGQTWALAYEHDWSFSDTIDAFYGIARARRVFDGNPEFVDAVYGNLNLRF